MAVSLEGCPKCMEREECRGKLLQQERGVQSHQSQSHQGRGQNQGQIQGHAQKHAQMDEDRRRFLSVAMGDDGNNALRRALGRAEETKGQRERKGQGE